MPKKLPKPGTAARAAHDRKIHKAAVKRRQELQAAMRLAEKSGKPFASPKAKKPKAAPVEDLFGLDDAPATPQDEDLIGDTGLPAEHDEDLIGDEVEPTAHTGSGVKPVIMVGNGGIWISINQFANETSRAPVTITRAVNNAVLKWTKGPQAQRLFRLKDLIDCVFFRDEEGEIDVKKLDPQRRKAHFEAEMGNLKFLERTQQLVKKDDVENVFAETAKVVVQMLETLPDMLERDCGLNAAQLQLVQDRIDTAREEMYGKLQNLQPAEIKDL